MPNITRKQAEAAIELALKESGHGQFSTKIARDPAMFTDIVFHAIKSLFPQMTFKRDEDLHFSSVAEDDETRTANVRLARHFRMLNPFSMEECFETTARAIADYEVIIGQLSTEVVSDEGRTLDRVVPLVKLRSQVENNNQEMATREASFGHRMASWQVTPDVVATAAFDLPTHYQFLTTKELEDMGVGIVEAKEAALANIRSAMEAVGLLDLDDPIVPEEGGIVCLGQIGGLASSIVLVDEFWRAQVEVCGEPLCILLRETDEILIWRASDIENGMQVMAALVVGAERTILPGILLSHDGENLRELGRDELQHENVARFH